MPAQTVMSKERVKVIEITVDSKGNPKIADENKILQLSRPHNEEVRWVSDLPFRIDFESGSPFYEDQFDHKYMQSGLVRRDVLPSEHRIYKYTIDVNGKKLDPGIRVYP